MKSSVAGLKNKGVKIFERREPKDKKIKKT